MKKATPRKSVRAFKNASVFAVEHPRYKFRVTYREGGKLKQRYFRLLKDAAAHAEEKSEELAAFGASASDLSAGDRNAIAEHRQFIEEHGFTIRDALENFCRHIETTFQSCSVAEAIDAYLEFKRLKKLSERTLETYRNRLAMFEAEFGSQSIATVTAGQVREYCLRTHGQSMRRTLSGLFGYAVLHLKACQVNPAEAKVVDLPAEGEGEIGILSAADVATILRNSPDEIRARVAIGIFGGLRRAEIDRLTWQDVDLGKRVIRLSGAVTKTKRKRSVPIAPNLLEWLLPLRSTGNVSPPNARRIFDRVRKASGFKPSHPSLDPNEREVEVKLRDWPQNCMRHSFGSFYVEQTKDVAATALAMGNTPAVVLRHYHQLVDADEAADFWSISPGVKAKVVSMAG